LSIETDNFNDLITLSKFSCINMKKNKLRTTERAWKKHKSGMKKGTRLRRIPC